MHISWPKCGLSDWPHFLFPLILRINSFLPLYLFLSVKSSCNNHIWQPEPDERSFWAQLKYAYSIQQAVWIRHILEMTGNLWRKWWVFFPFSFFFFPCRMWWFIVAETFLWLPLGNNMYPLTCSPVQLPALPTSEQNVNLLFFWFRCVLKPWGFSGMHLSQAPLQDFSN